MIRQADMGKSVAAAAFVFAGMLCFLKPASGEPLNIIDPYPPKPDCTRDCGHHDGDRHHEHGRPDRTLIDCSGLDPKAWHSITDAIRHSPPGSVLRVRTAATTMTCRETVYVDRPVTIMSDEGPGSAAIEAPGGQACIVADMALGDTFTLDRIKIIGRNQTNACVKVTAGTVVLKNLEVDSRSRGWAVDVDQSGRLEMTNSTLESDGGALRADRADVELENVRIILENEYAGTGVMLSRAHGHFTDVRISGGDEGINISPGAEGLMLTNLAIEDAQNAGIRIHHENGLGPVMLHGVHVSGARTGIDVEGLGGVRIEGGDVSSVDVGLRVTQAAAEVQGLTIAAGSHGIELQGAYRGEGSRFTGNTVRSGGDAAVFVSAPSRADFWSNRFDCSGHSHCFAGDNLKGIGRSGNSCHCRGSWLDCDDD